MYCTKCGNPVQPDAQFCPICGNAAQQQQQQPFNQYTQKTKTNTLALVGFITACSSLLLNLWGLVGIAALVLSIMGYQQITGTTENGKGFAIAGIIIGAFSILSGLLTLIFMETLLSYVFNLFNSF